MLRRSSSFKLMLAFVAWAALQAAWAQAFPAKTVRLVLAAPAGTAPDLAARILAEHLAARWGQAVVIDTRPGAGGMLAMETVKAAPADGHTLMFAHAGAMLVTPKVLKAARYDPVNDFTTLGIVAHSPMMIAAGNDVAGKTLPGLIQAARAAPGRLVIGSTEQATLPYLLGHGIAQAAGITCLHVPFNRPGQAMQALVNGDVQYYVDGIAPLLPLIKAGRIRAVAVASDRVLPGMEGIALVKDTLPGYVAVGWFALLGPKNLPPEVAARIHKDLNDVLAQDSVVARMHDVSLFPSPRSQADSVAFIQSEIDKWAAVISKAGIEPM